VPCTYSVHSDAHGSLHKSHWREQFLETIFDTMRFGLQQHTCGGGYNRSAHDCYNKALTRQPAASDPEHTLQTHPQG
jgi:hypothetical protein